MDDLQAFIDEMNNWGWSVNARINFNKFMDAIAKENSTLFRVRNRILSGKDY